MEWARNPCARKSPGGWLGSSRKRRLGALPRQPTPGVLPGNIVSRLLLGLGERVLEGAHAADRSGVASPRGSVQHVIPIGCERFLPVRIPPRGGLDSPEKIGRASCRDR